MIYDRPRLPEIGIDSQIYSKIANDIDIQIQPENAKDTPRFQKIARDSWR